MFPEYDVIVVGAGHAGCEAAAAAARMGSTVLLITMNMQTIAQMSCNPAMGGIAKGQIVREIDALGGMSGIVTDRSTVQFRMLNTSKGPGMWSPRAQCDRHLFAAIWRQELEKIPNLHFWQDTVERLLVSRGTVQGVETTIGGMVHGKTVVLTTGTFLNGIIHIGERQLGGGRIGEKSATGITGQLQSLGFKSDRLKTGTPPRIDGRSLDYSRMDIQRGDHTVVGFSYEPVKKIAPETQLPCHIAYTSNAVHEILKEGFNRSPMFNGRIEGAGPRYCPSIEDKINRFADKDQHQLFVEPEGWNTIEIYVNGFSTSLPEDVQFKALRQIKGFGQCRMFRPGYAIEYDFFPPTQLNASLGSKQLAGLFCAGQINGTTGYEEAACQGLMAGINAHLAGSGKEPFYLKRNEAYIGVLIDDLINKGTDEPYRMFTSRAEYRTLLRQDNADQRLTPLGHQLGLASAARMERLEAKNKAVKTLRIRLEQEQLTPAETNPYLEELGSAPIKDKQTMAKLLLRPESSLAALETALPSVATVTAGYDGLVMEQVEIQLKYETYIRKEQAMAERMAGMDDLRIPGGYNYEQLTALSYEARQKLTEIQPETLGQASRISGVNPTDIQILLVAMGR